MALSQRVFSDALYDMQRAMAVFDQPFFDSFFDGAFDGTFVNSNNDHHNRKRRKRINNNISNNINNLGRQPATDMIEQPDFYELHAEVPGYDKKDIKIEVSDDHTLILSGSVSKEHHEGPRIEEVQKEQESDTNQAESSNAEQQVVHKGNQDNQVTKYSSPKWWVNERVTGSFTRTFNFPQSIDADQIKASYQHGVLKIVVPKVSKNQSRFVNIE
ncbi:heat shock protein [Choanephora cucurbitarum]|uniref:Heat shock protein n=1 Tax=Choanephora cucurbitarum TaxID=101091 RepID=A0A1C7NJ94_9FUNG|nr:heat shock protein [Choanephora cucurbitarum]